ncbi:transcription factor bHLH61-like [Chenopodium quinoa]|uniref:transcription factor bHLH61-like n=1 Tax=Chenopodium quinoa TaxID=63459 RepID=UPI000B77140B|nr:transcription factor bHLH61-like [Chenopodium quinoa]
MEMNEDGFLEELLALRREAWETNPSSTTVDHQINGFFSSTSWPFDGLDSTTTLLPNTTSNTSYDSFSSSTIDHHPPPPTSAATTTAALDCSSFFLHPDPTFSGPGLEPDYSISSMIEAANDDNNDNHNKKTNILPSSSCKAEHSLSSGELEFEVPSPSGFNVGLSMIDSNNKRVTSNNGNVKSKVKKVEGQPSKNLMAERRRRKRLNDRLSMLRSVVPKISKMDRTSILGDTIDYMKELLERINKLQEEIDVGSNNNQLNVMSIFKDAKPNDVLVRNSPKFDVERRNLDTRVEICCAGKPGLLLSTVTTLEALGLEIKQCVISCFNDFSLQASCCEEMEQKSLINSEEIKQALFRNAGYGGRCL